MPVPFRLTSFQCRFVPLSAVAVILACMRLPCLGQAAPQQSLAHAQILLSPSASIPQQTAAHMLAEEVHRRSGVDWPIVTLPDTRHVQIVLVSDTKWPELARRLHLQVSASPSPPEQAESFLLSASHDSSQSSLVVHGRDDRGVLFGVGYLLRHLAMRPGSVTWPGVLTSLPHAESPAYPVRGHQLGYRFKNNTFDAWRLSQFEQYIRDLAVFGTNTIELIPPHSDDASSSPLFPLPPLQTMQGISAILDRYGLDCSIWYPALDGDYSDPVVVQHALAAWGETFRALPRVDAVFVPGGDPGHTAPGPLFALLAKEAEVLHRSHPHAQMWVSPQSFSEAWLQDFYALVRQHPAWLTGVVYGPEMRISPQQFRASIPQDLPIRFYPDLAHTLSAQYPVPDWYPVFALTEGREPIDPRPVDEATLFHAYAPFTQGFVAYSEGVNDDVNNILWSAWGWNPSQSAGAILAEYGRYFVAPDLAKTIVSLATGLEQNWRGPIAQNPSIASTLAQAEKLARPGPLLSNWRVQQLAYRAFYDAYLQARNQADSQAEQKAVERLRHSGTLGPTTTLARASALLREPSSCPGSALCRQVDRLAGQLFHSIGMQLSVARFGASATDRGANLDRVAAPISDLPWLRLQVASAQQIPGQPGQLARISAILERLTPSSNFYDDLGAAGRHPHLLQGTPFAQDPSGLTGVYVSAATDPPSPPQPLFSRTFAGTLYDRPLTLRYAGVDPQASYRISATFAADGHLYRLTANGTPLVLTCLDPACTSAETTLPPGIATHGALDLAWTVPPGRGGNGRSLKVSRVTLTR